MITFTDPTLSPKDQNMEAEWFVYFREYHDGKEFKRHTFRDGLNTKAVKKNKRERIKVANALIFDLRDMIKEGVFDPYTNIQYVTLSDSLDELLLVKASALKRKSMEGYKDSIKMFKNWLIDNRLKDILPEKFTNRMAHAYLEYLLKVRKYSGKSHNNQLGNMKNFFNWIFRRDRDRFKWIENPFTGIPRLPEEHGKIFAVTKKERAIIDDHLKKRNDPFRYCLHFMYYLAPRRPDLANLQRKDIYRENKMVVFKGSSSKNRHQDSVDIMPEFDLILEEMGIDNIPDHYYIFGKDFLPSETPITRINDFTEYFRNIATRLNIDPVKTFYGYKAAGLSDLYMETKNIFAVQAHARHADIQTTTIYLRGLGLIVNESIQNSKLNMVK